MGDSGHTQQQGEKLIAMTDNHGDRLSAFPVAPVNETAMVLLPEALNALKQVATMVGWDLGGAYLNLDAGCDSTYNRKMLFKAGMIPNITENPRNRKRFCNAAIHALRTRVDRTCAWEDTCKRLLRRFEHLQPRQVGMKLMAYTLINMREFCGA